MVAEPSIVAELAALEEIAVLLVVKSVVGRVSGVEIRILKMNNIM